MIARRRIGHDQAVAAEARVPAARVRRPSAYAEKVAAFCARIRQIRSTMDFARRVAWLVLHPGTHGLRKGDFDAAQRLINDLPQVR